MRAFPLATAFVAACFFAAPARAFETRTTGDLVAVCAGQAPGGEKAAAENFCDGFTQGVVQLELHHQKSFCLPDRAPKRRETLAQFVGWAQGHEDRLSLPATEGFLNFMKERFPCH